MAPHPPLLTQSVLLQLSKRTPQKPGVFKKLIELAMKYYSYVIRLVEWTTGMEYWNGLMQYLNACIQTIVLYGRSLCQYGPQNS